MHEIQCNIILNDMSSYPFTLTPPSSNEDSPQNFVMYSPPPNYMYPPSGLQPNIVSPQYMINTPIQYDLQMPNYSQDHKPPCLIITEQPTDKFRFRYKSEMAGTHGSLTGMTSDKTRKQTYPTVKLNNSPSGEVTIRCSLYQIGPSDNRQPHAHRLIKKQGQEELDDPHNTVVTQNDNYEASFHSMGIIHTAKKHIVGELKRKKTLLKEEDIARRESDRRKLNKKEEAEIATISDEECKSINLNIVCLRFDAFQKRNDILYPICKPIYSHAINNLKSALTGELKIVRMDHSSSPVKGNREIFMLVEKVTKKNIKIRFFETDEDDNETWSEYGKFSDLDVHHQYAIVFRTPPYRYADITEQRKVFIELERPSDGSRSEAREFTYTPSYTYKTGMKRPRHSYYSSSNEFSSGSMSGELLPLTLEQFQQHNLETAVVNSEDLAKALKNSDSDEFNKIFDTFGKDFLYNIPDDYNSLAIDSEKKKYTSVSDSNLDSKDKENIIRVYDEFNSFMKSKPKTEYIPAMLNHLFTKYVNEDKENVLHILVAQADSRMLKYWLSVIHTHKQHKILNFRNNNGETIIHIALQQQNMEAITAILCYNVDLSIKDNEGNTPLHVALKKSENLVVIDMLLRSSNKTDSFVNAENNDSFTALHMAIKMNRPKYVDILYKHKADVNLIDKKTGRNSLHLAIVEKATEIVKILLDNTDIDILKEDFAGYTPLKMAKHLVQDNESERIQIYEMIALASKDIHTEFVIKEEVESEEEEEVALERVELKIEKLSIDELEPMYKDVHEFTPDCLDAVSNILDASTNWLALAIELDLEHIAHTDMCVHAISPSKEFLKIASRLCPILKIRKCLENLNEFEAVSLIDNMVLGTKMET